MNRAALVSAVSLFEPLQLQFFQLGLLAAVLTLLAGAGVGFTVVLRRETYFGQGVGQAMIAGVAVGTFFELPAAAAALAGSLAAAAMIAVLARFRRVESDTAIAVVASSAFALGVAVISSDRERGVNITNVLFGNVLGVTVADVATLALAALAAWGLALLAVRRLTLISAAPRVAVAHGVAVARLELARTVTLAGVTAAAVQVVGVTLVVVALVLPAATAALVARTLLGVHAVAASAAVLVGVVGMYVSYWSDIASGPAIVLTAAAVFSATLAFSTAVDRSG
jgi:manganese/iron transport system permease protein